MTKFRWGSGDLKNAFLRFSPLKPDWQKELESLGFEKSKVFNYLTPLFIFKHQDGLILKVNTYRGCFSDANLYCVWQAHDQDHDRSLPLQVLDKFSRGGVNSPDGKVTYTLEGFFSDMNELRACLDALRSHGYFKPVFDPATDGLLRHCLVHPLDWMKIHEEFPEDNAEMASARMEELQRARFLKLPPVVQDIINRPEYLL